MPNTQLLPLSALRARAGLTAVEVAEIVGSVPATVRRWESGQTIPDGVQLQKLAELYKYPSDMIYLGDLEKYRKEII